MALDYCLEATPQSFQIQQFIDSFWNEAGLKRSLDKVYEIIVYSLFSTLVEAMKLEVTITVKEEGFSLLKEFEDFSRKVMCLDSSTTRFIQDARVYRVGVTNAADRGLDMYSNWGPAIQIKHLSLDVSLAEGIVNSVSSDKIIIVCKDAEKDVIVSLLSQIGWRSHIQSVVTENDLVNWYEKALRGQYSELLARVSILSFRNPFFLKRAFYWRRADKISLSCRHFRAGNRRCRDSRHDILAMGMATRRTSYRSEYNKMDTLVISR